MSYLGWFTTSRGEHIKMAAEQSDSDNSTLSSVDLSCGDSDYDIDDIPQEYRGTLPYQYEPTASTDEEIADEELENHEDRQARLSSTLWCQCGHCSIMPSVRECICCTEIPEMALAVSSNGGRCITEHPAFSSLCLDIYVLQTSYSWYNQQYRRAIAEENDRYRYTAYRLLVRYIWGWLGREIRVTLPACAVQRIRAQFPSPQGIYTGFLESGQA